MQVLFRDVCGSFALPEVVWAHRTLLSVAPCSIFFPAEPGTIRTRNSSAVRTLH